MASDAKGQWLHDALDFDAGGQQTSAVVTIPEVTVVGDPEAGKAYNLGFNDGQYGSRAPLHRTQFKGNLDLLAAYDEGYQDGQNAPPSELKLPSGDSIGPLSGEELEQGRAAQEAENKRIESIKEYA